MKCDIERLKRIYRAINTMQAIGRDCDNDCGYALLNCVLDDVHSLSSWRMDYGNENSGNHGHAGRPGHVGGSAPAGEGGGSEEPQEPKETKSEEERETKQKTQAEIDAQIKESMRQAQEKMAREAGFSSYKEWNKAQWKAIEEKAEQEENENESDFEEEDFEPTPEGDESWIDPETEAQFTSDPKRVQQIEDMLCNTYYSDRTNHEAFRNKLSSVLDKIEEGTVLKFTNMDSDGNEFATCEVTKIDGHWEIESNDAYDTLKFQSTEEIATYIDQKYDADNVYRVKETYDFDFCQNLEQWDDYTKSEYSFNPLPTSGEVAWRDRAEQTVSAWDSSTPEERKALRDYTSEDFQWINQVERGTFMRTDLHSEQELKAKSDALAKMIDKCEMKKTTQLVRGVDYSALQAMCEQFNMPYSKSKLEEMSARKLGEVLVGRTITEQGFSSCSSGGQSKYGDSKVQMHILCPKGTKGIYAEPYSNWGQKWSESKAVEPPPVIRDENETILQRGTSFHIDHVVKGGENIAIWVRVVGQGDEELEW